MAAVPLFRDTNMAAVTSRENTLLGLKGNFLQIFSNFFMSAKRHKGVILANSGEM